MEEVLSSAPPNMPRGRSWRMLPQQSKPIKSGFGEEGFQYRWSLSKRLVRSTQLFSDDFEELANIAQVYQLSLPIQVCLQLNILFICPVTNLLTLFFELAVKITRNMLHGLNLCLRALQYHRWSPWLKSDSANNIHPKVDQ
jgi:hypothetical protein